MMSDPWFKPKTYGYGVNPSNWKGWLATIGFVSISILLTVPFLVIPAAQGNEPTTVQVSTYFILLAVLIAGFVKLTKLKSEGDWRWRWGKTDTE